MKAEFPHDTRKLMDFRRSGSQEAQAGGVDTLALATKLANSINQSKRLQDTYLPKRAATVRLADEARKPGRQKLRAERPANEKLKLADSLAFMVELLGADNALVKQVLDGKSPEARANELIAGTKLENVEFRKELAKGGKAAIDASTDPVIVVTRLIDAKAREARKRYESELTGVERANYSKIARARFETEGTKLYPDATFTLRLSYGAVEGYMENGKKVPPFTTLGGLYARADAHKQEFPYNLPPRWLEKKKDLNLNTPFNFVSTDDIIGGNSGSPSINQNGELVGLIFDGNIQSLVGDFMYDGSVNRAISVDSRGMLEVLKKVFNANEIAAELTATS